MALLHDAIEDGDVTREDLLEAGLWDEEVEAIDAITRRQNERYMDYIARVAENPLATQVKLADLFVNLKRCGDDPKHASLRKRYERAHEYLRRV